jgi:hypothetical protein
MKTLVSILLVNIFTFYTSVFAEEVSNKQGVKTGAEVLVNGTALIGITGAMTDNKQERSYEGRKAGVRTWTELGDMHRSAGSGVADFGK